MDKQKSLDEEPEPEMKENPKGLEMCEFEGRNYNKCSECPKQIEDMLFCKQNQMAWRLSQIEKLLQAILEELKKR